MPNENGQLTLKVINVDKGKESSFTTLFQPTYGSSFNVVKYDKQS